MEENDTQIVDDYKTLAPLSKKEKKKRKKEMRRQKSKKEKGWRRMEKIKTHYK